MQVKLLYLILSTIPIIGQHFNISICHHYNKRQVRRIPGDHYLPGNVGREIELNSGSLPPIPGGLATLVRGRMPPIKVSDCLDRKFKVSGKRTLGSTSYLNCAMIVSSYFVSGQDVKFYRWELSSAPKVLCCIK